MGARDYIRTIEDLEKLYYTPAGAEFIKKDAPVISTTTGVYNAVYGAQVWAQLNQEANVFGCLPKIPWGRSGWRFITARATSPPTGGVAENGNLPATIKPTFAEVSTKPKTVANNFDVSEVQEFIASEADDDAIGNMAFLRQYMGIEHKEHLNKMLLTDVDTLASNNIESVDRIISSGGTTAGVDATVTIDSEEALVTADDPDIYSIDRSANDWSNSYVDANGGTDRDLTESLLINCYTNVLKLGGNPTFWLTGYDTYASILKLYEVQVRYNLLGTAQIQPSVNGIVTPQGSEVGIKVATLYGIPIILSKDIPQDTLSRIYLVDTSNPEGYDIPRLSLKVAKPTQYFEAGMNTGDPFGIGRLGNEGMYRTMGELICTFFGAQGKIRDLQ